MEHSARAYSDQDLDAEWEFWHRDTFDRKSPPRVDVKGRGLAKGLTELWARYLFESIGLEGRGSFSNFHLWWKQGQKCIDITGDWAGATRLRRWVFGTKQRSDRGYVEEGNAHLLKMIAATHAKLILSNQSGEGILAATREADDRQEFERRLHSLSSEGWRHP